MFTLVWNIKVILHQKELMFEGSDTTLLQRSIEFSSLEQDVFEQLKNCWTKENNNNNNNNAKTFSPCPLSLSEIKQLISKCSMVLLNPLGQQKSVNI